MYTGNQIKARVNPIRDADLYKAIESYRTDRVAENNKVLMAIADFPPQNQKQLFNFNATMKLEEKQQAAEMVQRFRNEIRDPKKVGEKLDQQQYIRLKARKAKKKKVNPFPKDLAEKEQAIRDIN